MNCSQLTRIADTMEISLVSDAERRDAELHAGSCRRCAAVWSIHSALACETVESVPAELVVRCRTAWASPQRAAKRQAARRMTLTGSVMVLAAAAAILTIWASKKEPGSSTVQTTGVAASDSSGTEPPTAVAATAAASSADRDVPEPELQMQLIQPPPPAALPLLPKPPSAGAQRGNIALEKALELFPELTEGPVLEGRFFVGLALRPDGTVLISTIRHTTGDNLQQIDTEVQQSLPRDGDGSGTVSRRRLTPLPDGRVLRAELSIWHAWVGENHDMARSDLRVREILGERYADLMQPVSSGALNRVVIFLSEDGAIKRQTVERSVPASSGVASDAALIARVARVAAQLASQMDLDPDQIGVMGNTAVQRQGENGSEALLVRYAWQRRTGESGPSLGQASPAVRAPRVNADDALIVVKHVLPDAFTHKDPALGSPTIVLTAKGEVIQAGWVKTEVGRPTAQALNEQLVPGVEMGYFNRITVTDETGAAANVLLAWEAPKQK